MPASRETMVCKVDMVPDLVKLTEKWQRWQKTNNHINECVAKNWDTFSVGKEHCSKKKNPELSGWDRYRKVKIRQDFLEQVMFELRAEAE